MSTGIRRRWVPSGRVVGVVALVLTVIVSGCYLSKPLWQPWWYAETLCGGHVTGGDLAALLPEKQLQAGRDTFEDGHGRLQCAVNEDDDHFVLAADAQTDPAAVRQALRMEFTIPSEPTYVFDRGTPGYYGQFGPVLIQECPKLGRDAEGRRHRLVTRVLSHGVENRASTASLRMAVSLANGAAEDLGCGTEPLPLPDHAGPPRRLSLRQAAGTMCGWLAGASLPKSPSGKGWKVAAPTDRRAPITNCSLLDAGTGKPAVDFTGWYGDWTQQPFEMLLGANVDIRKGHSSRDALMSENFGRAKAHCAGEAANFLADSPGTDAGRAEQLPSSRVRSLLNAFAKDQAERRHCTGLDLPGPTIHPSAH